jgi:predicted RNA-binding Zn-ribbon protein involved in translation (DUF1610 family)
MDNPFQCPHCAKAVFRKSASGATLKAKATIIVLHKSGAVEFNCGACKRAIILPTQFRQEIALRKAVFTVPKS